METTLTKIKHSGQVFTPDYLVKNILDCASYTGTGILRKHAIDNSCGDGAFLCEMVARYIEEFRHLSKDDNALKKELERYIHGIELDSEAYSCCQENLNSLAAAYGLANVKWDLLHRDTLAVARFDGKMDYVLGNPPYVRVHHLEGSYDNVKAYTFATGGMTDLYLVFFEIGLRMLKTGGTLCYITPSSWINSLAGTHMRTYIYGRRCLKEVIDIGHFQPFSATTYTMITLLQKGQRFEAFDYYCYDGERHDKRLVARLAYDESYINGSFFLGSHDALENYKNMVTTDCEPIVKVKNGFATLADKVFIKQDFPFKQYIIPVIKGSTGKWQKAFFPYDKNGKPYPKEAIFGIPQVAHYLNENKPALLKEQTEAKKTDWYLYGRSQALKDVYSPRIAINTLIRDIPSVKLNEMAPGTGIYSGLYILGSVDIDTVRSILLTDDFIAYISLLKKYKSSGYYTFNSKDLELYLNHQLTNKHYQSNSHNKPRLSEGYLNFF